MYVYVYMYVCVYATMHLGVNTGLEQICTELGWTVDAQWIADRLEKLERDRPTCTAPLQSTYTANADVVSASTADSHSSSIGVAT